MAKRRDRRSVNKTAVLTAVSAVLAAVLVAVTVVSFKKSKEMRAENEAVQEQLNSQISRNMRSGYVAMTNINQGDLLVDGVNVQYSTQIPSNVDAASFAASDVIGKEALLDISVGVPIMNTMVAEELPGKFTERECTFIHLSANLTEGDYVDVRVLFPNGEDYIVAAKKCIKKPVILSNLVYLWLTEEEINSLDAAVVDANLHSAKIYTVRYIRPEVQEANIATYQPNDSVIQLMQSNPNIVTESARALSVKARVDLEQRLQLFEEAYPDFELDDEAGENGVSEKASQQAAGVQQGSGSQQGKDDQQGSGSQQGSQNVTYGD